jgi:nascent polypeptide-associated complex subunit alpha
MFHPFSSSTIHRNRTNPTPTQTPNTMSSVKDELAALRSAGTVRAHASALSSKSGLSTPEAEQASLSQRKKEDRTKKAEAEELLRKTKAGGGLVEEELKRVGERKKEDERGRFEAKSILSKGATAGKNGDGSDVIPVGHTEEPKPTDETVVRKTEVDDNPPLVDRKGDDNTPNLEDDEVPELEEAEEVPNLQEEPAQSTTTTNRNEKKVRKIMSRLSMIHIPNIVRASIKTSAGQFFIEQPDVYMSNSGGTYVLFGEARQQQQSLRNPAQSAVERAVENLRVERTMENAVEVSEGMVDDAGLESKDVELVMAQASVERSVAVKALKENDGDLVNAIMSLTT